MLTNWVAAGQSPDIFWDQTFATFNAVMLGAAKHFNTLHQIAIAGAHAGECFAREKRLKKLASYLPEPALSEGEVNAARDDGARKLLMMVRRKKARQDAGDAGKAKANG